MVIIGNTYGIRVVDNKNVNETVSLEVVETTTQTTTMTAKLEMPQVTTTSNLPDSNQTNDTLIHKNGYDSMKMRYIYFEFVSLV